MNSILRDSYVICRNLQLIIKLYKIVKKYKNLSGNSGVLKYEIFTEHIIIQFKSQGSYYFSYKNPGQVHVEKMKDLAEKGQGLSTYISKYVKNNYEYKF